MGRDFNEIWQLVAPQLYEDVTDDQSFFVQKPLLAHYTTVSALEKIVSSNEMWFSNPLFMNDVEEMRFGFNEGTAAFLQDAGIKEALGDMNDEYESVVLKTREWFETNHAFDTYVLCMSQHDEGDSDGLLSMWRGYGDGGRGAALVFDARKFEAVQNTPLIISRVMYGSREERLAWFASTGEKFAKILRTSAITREEIGAAVMALFFRLASFAMFTKHSGFREEREWRLAYFPQHDEEGLMKQYFSYFNGPRGVEPKLKLPINALPTLSTAEISLEVLVQSIILGPSHSSVLALQSIQRMLTALGRPELAERVIASRIPFRA